MFGYGHSHRVLQCLNRRKTTCIRDNDNILISCEIKSMADTEIPLSSAWKMAVSGEWSIEISFSESAMRTESFIVWINRPVPTLNSWAEPSVWTDVSKASRLTSDCFVSSPHGTRTHIFGSKKTGFLFVLSHSYGLWSLASPGQVLYDYRYLIKLSCCYK